MYFISESLFVEIRSLTFCLAGFNGCCYKLMPLKMNVFGMDIFSKANSNVDDFSGFNIKQI